jgi:hypothetical protein
MLAGAEGTHMSSSMRLPYRPELSSETLSASHLFTIEILSVDAAPWRAESDGLDHRRLTMEVKLLDVFKGTLHLRPGETFRVDVEQRREGEYTVSDYHGLWSHIEPEVGQRYLVVANGIVTSPAALMQEGAAQQLLDAAYASDVRFDLEAEQVFQDALAESQDEDPELNAAHRLLMLAVERRAVSRDVVARYVWDYVEPVFLRTPEQVLPEILSLITAADANLELRRSLIADLYDAVLLNEMGPSVVSDVIRAFFSLLLQESARPLYQTLVDVQLYNLIVEGDEPTASADSVFPARAQRDRYAAVLRGLDSDSADVLVAWLEQ